MVDHRSELTKSQAAGLVSLLGLTLLSIPVLHHFGHQQSVLTTATGVVIPALFALVIVATGPWFAVSDFDNRQISRVAVWIVAGGLVGGVVGVGIFGHVLLLGYSIPEGPFITGNLAIVGAVGGLLVGYYEMIGKRRSATAARSTARFQAVFEGTHDALVIADDDGTYVDANPAAAELFGVERETLIGMSIREFADPDFDFDTEWSDFRQEKVGRGQFPLVRPDGTTRIVEFAATGDIYAGHHLSALRDVTERVNYEHEIERQRETLSFLNQILRHNVLNSVHVILARAEMLDGDTTESRHQHLSAITNRGHHIAELVNRVKRLNETMWDGTPPEQFDIGAAVETVATATQSSFHDASVNVVDWTDDALLVNADTMLEEVFENLLVNAIRHNDTDDPEVTIELTTDDESVIVRIADNGPGIPDAKKDIVFNRGEKGPASDGTGFGLYIVRTLVTRYDGSVTISNNDPRGSIFTLTFPRVERPATTP